MNKYLNRVNYSVSGAKNELNIFCTLLEKTMNERPEKMDQEDVAEMVLAKLVSEHLNSKLGFTLRYRCLSKCLSI